MARKRLGRRAYATDLTDDQWALIASLIPEADPGGRPRKASSRELVNAILYFLCAGMAWRLPGEGWDRRRLSDGSPQQSCNAKLVRCSSLRRLPDCRPRKCPQTAALLLRSRQVPATTSFASFNAKLKREHRDGRGN